jgi:phosphopantothenoylcysteine synthetase/decarboxylase
MNNPSLREQPRHQRATVIPQRQESSILDWLEQTGRLLAREPQDDQYANEEEEITELMGVEDHTYDDIEDDDELDLDE